MSHLGLSRCEIKAVVGGAVKGVEGQGSFHPREWLQVAREKTSTTSDNNPSSRWRASQATLCSFGRAA
jgi:hypothetical protein